VRERRIQYWAAESDAWMGNENHAKLDPAATMSVIGRVYVATTVPVMEPLTISRTIWSVGVPSAPMNSSTASMFAADASVNS
jgi:hypothetical protein